MTPTLDNIRFEPKELLRSFNQVMGFSAQSSYDRSGIHDLYQTAHLTLGGIPTVEGEPLEWVLRHFAPVKTARATIIHPGGFIAPHIDVGRPYLDRWQIPVQPSGSFVVDGIEIEQRAGIPWQVEYWRPHSVLVPTDSQPRFAIVIDRAIPAPARPPDADYVVLGRD